MTHGLDHSDADVVVEAGPGLYFRRLLDGRIEVVKYRTSNPNAGELADFRATLEPEQWHQLIAAVGLGESPVVGEIKPAVPPAAPPKEPEVVSTGAAT